ncbi:MAG: phosphonate ABC transporter ATP-binding protein [Alphaproteobacteria bacterium]|nr:phosphonate ABC transporter ATP-binding protein [Alphaproteobacteria bacterium]
MNQLARAADLTSAFEATEEFHHATGLSPTVAPRRASPAIAVRELRKAFAQRQVIKGISFDVQPGEFVVLLGPSGCGKSTLFRCLTRLIEPDDGTIVIDGTDVTKLSRGELVELRRHIGFVFQQFNLVKRFAAIDNVLAARLGYVPLWRVVVRRFPHADRQLALACLDSVGLLEYAYQRVERLSGGQQQRVAIARALAQQSNLILADEPISSLDPESAENVMQILQKCARERKLTVFCSMHQVDLATRFADRIIALKAGEVFFQGPPSQFTVDIKDRLYAAV